MNMLAALMMLGSLANAVSEEDLAEDHRPTIQMAILLDTSGSMDGLIEQAKSQLWRIVNEFINARQNGEYPEVQLALYEYGKQTIPGPEGYLRMISALTTDLDRVSEELFALTTDGGEEYCGKVIKAAVEGLQWSKHPTDMKIILIAGNEPFTQGDVDFREAARLALTQDIYVDTIYCGEYDQGIESGWEEGALLTDGEYTNIDENTQAMHINAPQDEDITRLGHMLNDTYIPYGEEGRLAQARQQAQDANALASIQGTAFQRAVCKASANYVNSGWDLVDACNNGVVKLAKVKKADLPPKMKNMTPEERRKYIEDKTKERQEIQDRINQLNDQRNKFVAARRKELSESNKTTLETAIIKAIHTQCERKNFVFAREARS